MNTIRLVLVALTMLTLAGCATNPKLHRASRPEAIKLKEDAVFTMPWDRTTDVRIPAGEYRYSWEDAGYWYFDSPTTQITSHIKGRISVTRPGGFAMAKDYDEIGLVLYCERQDMERRGIGDAVIAMGPKHNGKVLSWEGDIPKDKESLLSFIGNIAR